MSDKIKIYAGVMVFLGLVLFPVWYRPASGSSLAQQEIVVKTRTIPGKDQCVMPAAYMRTSHMILLDNWRQTVVRSGDRSYLSPDGRHFQRSLTGTCLDCHSNKSRFCDRCHNYLSVRPDCWECHVEPREDGQ
jgi:hypothetical protein